MRHELSDTLHQAGFSILLELEIVATGMALITHLRDHFVFLLCLHQQIELVERVSERLLDIDSLPAAHRFHRDDKVRMIRCPHEDRVDLLVHLVKHLAKIRELRGLGELFKVSGHARFRRGVANLRVAQRYDIAQARTIQVVDVFSALIANADAGEIDLLIC